MEVRCLFDKLVKISDIKSHPKNRNVHPKSQIKRLAKILNYQGWRYPVKISKLSGCVTSGHGRIEAAKLNGWNQVPCNFQNYESEEQEYSDVQADNAIALWAEMDKKLIIEDIKLLQSLDVELLGFEEFNIPDLEKDKKEDEVPEGVVSTCKKGDIFLLGNHRLICGDSTSKEVIHNLMGNEIARMVHTDPPYNVDYGVSKKPRHKIRTIENDKQSPEEWEIFCKKIYENFKDFCSGDVYMWGASCGEGMKMRLLLIESGCHWSATIIWNKDRMVLTPANYQRKYEPCFYGWYNKSSFNGERNLYEVWECKRPSNSKLHPTMKPIELCEMAITASSKSGDIVLDLFGGSGSTLIACEKTNRRCFMAEIDEHYCDVIIERWCNYTGINKITKNGEEVEWKAK
jgi:DNA modification methylase